MKICVLQPDYQTSDVDYKNFDPPRNLSHLLPGDEVKHVFLNKLYTYRQLKELSRENFDIYVNLCEGYLDWSVPSIDVIHSLELLNLPYTGPDARLYDPPKPFMKYLAYCAGVKTPAFAEVNSITNIRREIESLSFPLFVKPAKAGDSLGVDNNSLARDIKGLENKIKELLHEKYEDILVEEYIEGREFTVLVAANPNEQNNCTLFKPVEYIFPGDFTFKTYSLKTSELHPWANVPCNDEVLEQKLRIASENIFKAFSGVGYARLDFRVDPNEDIYFLEINFTCSVFYEGDFEGSADHILQHDPAGKSGFLKHIIDEGIARHKAGQKKCEVKYKGEQAFGIFTFRYLQKGERILSLEEGVERKSGSRSLFLPVHSPDPNTVCDGGYIVALYNIDPGTELTIDHTCIS